MKNTSIRRISIVFLGITIIDLMTSLPLFSQVRFPLSKLYYVVEPGNTYTVPWSLEPGLRIGISL